MKADKTLIVPFGSFPHQAGVQVIDDEAARRILEKLKTWNRDIVIDYGHASMEKCSVAPAAGWVKKGTAKIGKSGIEAFIEWTDEATKLIAEKKYRFLSPVFEATSGRITALINLGLTNNPNIHAMPALVNQLTVKEPSMDTKVTEKKVSGDSVETSRKRMITALDLDTDADCAIIAEAVEQLANHTSLASLLSDVMSLLGLTSEADDETVIEKIKLLADKAAQSKTGEVEMMVNDAIRAGRLAPSLKPWAQKLLTKNPESFNTYLLNSAPAIPTGELITKEGPRNTKNLLSESEASICRSLGIDADDFATYGK